jgi:hypothetical protein
MLAQICKRKKILGIALGFFAAASFTSCATHKPPAPLVSDPDQRPESQLPWNKQEQWEIAPNVPEDLQGRH